MTEDYPLNEWLAEKDILYILEPGDMYSKGKNLPRNRFVVHIINSNKSATEEERQKLQDDIHAFLKQRATA